jgi:tetratricopeptide (TPR) repeat protein
MFVLGLGLVLLGLLGLGCAHKSPAGDPKAIDVYIQGLDAYRRGDNDRAIADLQRASKLNPELRMPHSILGDIYVSRGDLDHALQQYKEMVRLDPYTANTHYRLGLVYQLMHRLQDAAATYLRALELDPRDPKTTMNLGLVYLALDQENDSVKYLRRATELAPNSADAWSNYGAILDITGNHREAESAYKRSLELDGTKNATIVNLGINLMAQNRANEAISVLEQGVRNEDSAPMHKRYGDALLMAKRYDDAVEQYDLALQKDAGYVPALNEKGNALIRKYQKGLELDDELLRAAIESWRTSLSINPKQPRIEASVKQWQASRSFGR